MAFEPELEGKGKVKEKTRIVYDPTKDRMAGTEVKEPDKVTERAKRPVKAPEYPVSVFVNAYDFIHIPRNVRRDLGWGERGEIVNLVAEKNADGSLTLRRKIP